MSLSKVDMYPYMDMMMLIMGEMRVILMAVVLMKVILMKVMLIMVMIMVLMQYSLNLKVSVAIVRISVNRCLSLRLIYPNMDIVT